MDTIIPIDKQRYALLTGVLQLTVLKSCGAGFRQLILNLDGLLMALTGTSCCQINSWKAASRYAAARCSGSTESFMPTAFNTARSVFNVGFPLADRVRYSDSRLIPASAATAPRPP